MLDCYLRTELSKRATHARDFERRWTRVHSQPTSLSTAYQSVSLHQIWRIVEIDGLSCPLPHPCSHSLSPVLSSLGCTPQLNLQSTLVCTYALIWWEEHQSEHPLIHNPDQLADEPTALLLPLTTNQSSDNGIWLNCASACEPRLQTCRKEAMCVPDS